jgi:hypothetical protein
MTCMESMGLHRRRGLVRAALCGLAGATLAAVGVTALGSAAVGGASGAAHPAVVTGLPLHFEPNLGQASADVRYLAHGADYAIALTDSGATLALTGHAPGSASIAAADVLRLRVAGASAAHGPGAEAPLPGRINYVVGADPSKWHLGVHTYGRVRYANAYPGIDLVYYGTEGRLEYDFRVAAGSSPKVVQLAFDGADALRVDRAGTLHVTTHGHELRFERPVAYQTIAGTRKPVTARYHLDGTTIGFDVGTYDRTAMLVIDPVLSYLTYLGGSGVDVIGAVQPQVAGPTGQAAALDGAGNLYLAGYTQSTNFPTQLPFAAMPSKAAGSTWAFVTKLAPDGKSLVFSTYLGGTQGNDYGYAVALDAQGNAFVVGMTTSNDFPVTSGAYQTLCSPNYTNSPNNPFASCNSGPSSAFVTKLGPSGVLLASTFLSGTASNAFARAVAVDAAGRPYVVGTALPGENIPAGVGGLNEAVGFPVTTGAIVGPYNYTPNVVLNGALQNDAFVTVFDPTLKTLVYSTLIGDTQALGVLSNLADTKGTGVAIDSAGNFYVVGTTQDSYLPTTPGAVQGALSSCGLMYPSTTVLNGVCGFAVKFTPVGQASAPSLGYLTYLGGSPTGQIAFANQVAGVAVDAAGDAFIVGFDNEAGFPTTAGAYQTTCAGYNAATNSGSTNCSAAFIAKLNPTGTKLLASTYYGCVTCSGDAVYTAGSIVLDAASNVYIAGVAGNSVATAGGFATNNGGGASPFVAEFDSGLATLRFGTLLNVGGAGQLSTGGLAVGTGNSIYLAGSVNSPTGSAATAGAFQATYGGGSSDGFVAKIIVTATTKTTLAVTPASSIGGAAVTFTATVVESPGSGVPTGNVTFNSGTSALGTAALNASGVATFTTSSLAAGSYSVTAAYAGDSGNMPSTSTAVTATVTAATTTTLSAAPASAAVGTSVTFTATVTESPGSAVPGGAVTFANGATMLGTGTLNAAGVASFTTSSLAAGAYSVTAVYGGDTLNNPSTSSAVAVTINPPAPTVTVSVSPASVTVGATATVTWSSTNATACTASGSWSGAEAASGSQSVTPSTSGTLTFGLQCSGAGGSGSGSATLTVNAKPAAGGSGGGGAFDVSTLVALAAIALTRRLRRTGGGSTAQAPGG